MGKALCSGQGFAGVFAALAYIINLAGLKYELFNHIYYIYYINKFTL